MVIKGKARGSPAALAKHLERRDTNELVYVRELLGVTARDLAGALHEMDTMGSEAASKRTLYHAAINAAPDERLTDEQKRRTVECLEIELGFTGQPRVVVEHLKKGREHIHVVFLRIDTDRMIAIPDSHNYRKHEIVARELEREFGHRHVQGAHIGRDGQERPKRTPGHDEMQQAERTGVTPQEATRRVTDLWQQADNSKAFTAAISADGWVLAKGDRRDFVLVDHAGEPHSLARRIEGVKAAEVRQRLSDIDPATLPSVEEARAQQRSRHEVSRSKEKEKEKAPHDVSGPVALKIPAMTATNSAAPLALDSDPSVHAPRKAVLPSPRPPVEPKREPEQKAAVGRLKQLYTSFADATHRAYTKARCALKSKDDAARPPQLKQPRRAKSVSKREDLTPLQQAMRERRKVAQQSDRSVPPPTEPTPSIAHEPALRDDRPPGRKRMTPEELDAMLDRQRIRRDDRGPSL